MKIVEVIKPVAPVAPLRVADAQLQALKQTQADVRKHKALLRVTQARERLTKAQQSQTALQNNSTRHPEISMLVLEIVARKPLTPAQLMTARVKTQQQSIKRQKADANVMRKREELLKAQQQRAAVGWSV